MDKLRQWIGKWQTEINTTITIVIAVAVVLFGGWNIVIAVKDFGKRKMNEGLRSLGYAALIVLIGMIGWGGLTALVKLIAPNEAIVPTRQNLEEVEIAVSISFSSQFTERKENLSNAIFNLVGI